MQVTQVPTGFFHYFLQNGSIDSSKINISLENPPTFPHHKLETIDWNAWLVYINDYQHLPIYVGIIYICVIFGIQHWMKNRKPFELKRELFLWNAALGIFSILGFLRTAPEFFYQLFKPDGFYRAACFWEGVNTPTAFWATVFVLSKYVELGDTVFIVLRKKPLQFIQWYHHIITLSIVWVTFPYAEPTIRHYGVMNYGVHSLMYPYFALRALDVKIPRVIANLITTLQMAQMFIGLFINSYTGYMLHVGTECRRHPNSVKLFFFLYGSFVVLFSELFYTLVVRKKKKQK